MNMLRKILFFGLMTVAGTVFGQNRNTADKVDRPNTKKINFGVRAGFNSSMFMVSELKIKDVTIDEVQNNYKIGYFGALFMRINMKKHYIQPEVSYNVTKCEITFDKLGSQHPAIEPDYASVQSVLHTSFSGSTNFSASSSKDVFNICNVMMPASGSNPFSFAIVALVRRFGLYGR